MTARRDGWPTRSSSFLMAGGALESIDTLRATSRAEFHLFLRIHDTAMPFSLYYPRLGRLRASRPTECARGAHGALASTCVEEPDPVVERRGGVASGGLLRLRQFDGAMSEHPVASPDQGGDHGQVQWSDARVVIVEVLCTAEQQEQLVSQVSAALEAFEDAVAAKQGRWITTGIRLRQPRDDAERAWLVESLTQPDDPLAIERRPMVLEIGGKGSEPSAEKASEAVLHALCPDDLHSGPCPIPWGSTTLALRQESRAEKSFYRDLFPRSTHR